ERPGRWHDRRQKIAANGERIFTKWGWLAVFLVSTIICGMLKMKYSRFVVWNFIDALVYVLAVGPAAHGAGKVAGGGPGWGSRGAGRGGDHRRVRRAGGQVLPPAQGPQTATKRQRRGGQPGITVTAGAAGDLLGPASCGRRSLPARPRVAGPDIRPVQT